MMPKTNPRNDYISLCQKLQRPINMDYGREYDQLLKHKLIKSIIVENGNLIVNTRLITVKYKKSVYALGEFKIKFKIVTNSIYDTYFKNITGFIMKKPTDKRETWFKIYHHPHIMDYHSNYDEIDDESNQDACLGNITNIEEELINKGLLAQLIYLYLNFLQSYQGSYYTLEEDDEDYEAYISIARWPRIKPKTKKHRR